MEQGQLLVHSTHTPRGITSDMIMDPRIFPSPVDDSLVPVDAGEKKRQEVDTQRSASEVTKEDRGGGGEEVITSRAETISNIPVAFSTTRASDGPQGTSRGEKAGEGAVETTETETTSKSTTRADETDSLPQNDQPTRFGQKQQQQQHEDVVVGGDGADSGRGYYHSNNKMSNGMLDGASSHQPQDRHSPAAGGGKGFTDMDIQCPSLKENSACPCYKFLDGESDFIASRCFIYFQGPGNISLPVDGQDVGVRIHF